jgi:hypothetical protein
MLIAYRELPAIEPATKTKTEKQSMQNVTKGQNLMEASNQWATRPADQRFPNMAALAAAVNARRQRSRSVDVDLATVQAKALDEGGLRINGRIQSVEPSHWSFSQLSSWIGAPAEYLRRLPAPLAADNINHGIRSLGAARDTLKFMTIESENETRPNTLQAVTSATYGRIWDADVIAAVERIQERNPAFHNPPALARHGSNNAGLYASDHDCFIFMIDGGSFLEAGPRAQLNRGFIVWNSETGARTFGLMTFLHNGVCGNHIIWGATEINKLVIRHSAGGPSRFDTEAAPALLAYTQASAAPMIETIKRAQSKIVAPDEAGARAWLFKNGFTRKEAQSAVDFAKAEEGDARTIWQLVQGATAYARGFDFIDTRIDLETRAGKLLDLAALN